MWVKTNNTCASWIHFDRLTSFTSKIYLFMRAIFLDMETTGLDSTRHFPIEIALKIVDVSTSYHLTSYQTIINPSLKEWEKHDPISLEVNGFNWEEVSQGKELKLVAKEIITLFSDLNIERGNAVYVCQNPAFDRGFFNHIIDVYTQEGFNWPYHWLDLASMFWATLQHSLNRSESPFPTHLTVSKNDIARAYHILPETQPHRAMRGVEHLISCYEAVLGVKFRG